jgi:hypothetical protein
VPKLRTYGTDDCSGPGTNTPVSTTSCYPAQEPPVTLSDDFYSPGSNAETLMVACGSGSSSGGGGGGGGGGGSSDSNSNSKLGAGAIAGIVIGGVAGLALLIALCVYCLADTTSGSSAAAASGSSAV